MRIRAFVAAAVVAGLAFGPQASAARAPQVKDLPGDANAVNDQGLCILTAGCGIGNDNATPGSQAAFDILSVTVDTIFVKVGKKKVPSALVVTEKFAAAPSDNFTVHRVTGEIAGCAFMLVYTADESGKSSHVRQCGEGTAGLSRDTVAPMAKLGANSITWTIPFKTLLKLPVPVKVGQKWENLGAHNRLVPVAVTVPQIDQVESAASFKLGS